MGLTISPFYGVASYLQIALAIICSTSSISIFNKKTMPHAKVTCFLQYCKNCGVKITPRVLNSTLAQHQKGMLTSFFGDFGPDLWSRTIWFWTIKYAVYILSIYAPGTVFISNMHPVAWILVLFNMFKSIFLRSDRWDFIVKKFERKNWS